MGWMQTIRKLIMPIVWHRHLMKNIAEERRERTLTSAARLAPRNPALCGFRVYSQTDEDGIIQEIFNRIGGGETFLEIGCGSGIENNTAYLLLKGWRGEWIDGNPKNIASIRRNLPASARLKVVEMMVDRDNVQTLNGDVDFFSLDIDGNDLEVLLGVVKNFSPRVICVEYNAKFPPPLDISIKYNPSHSWKSDDYQGASLQAFVNALSGYTLVCCGMAGLNAFFVHNGEMASFEQYAAETLYRPYSLELFYPYSGHPASYGFLADSLAKGPMV